MPKRWWFVFDFSFQRYGRTYPNPRVGADLHDCLQPQLFYMTCNWSTYKRPPRRWVSGYVGGLPQTVWSFYKLVMTLILLKSIKDTPNGLLFPHSSWVPFLSFLTYLSYSTQVSSCSTTMVLKVAASLFALASLANAGAVYVRPSLKVARIVYWFLFL